MSRNYIDPEVREYLQQDLGLNVKELDVGDNLDVPGTSVVLNSAPVSFKTTDGREGILYEDGSVEIVNE